MSITPFLTALDSMEGRSVVAFRLDTLGNIFATEVIRGLHPILDKEALRVVNLMPKWKPYRIRGTGRECPFAIPVTFRRKDMPQEVVNDGWLEFAEFPGGFSELTKYITESIICNYKGQIWNMSIDSVWVKNGLYRFIVTEEGKIRQLQTIRESSRTLERMALYVLSQMPEWKPAKKRTGNAACCFTVPVNWKDIFLEIQDMRSNK